MTISLTDLGKYVVYEFEITFPGRARSSSNYRRLQRFFEQVDFDYDRLAEFLVAMMGLQAGPWRLTMDRTNWRLGRRDVNILMIGIVNRAIAIPVCWRVLDKAGNSNTKERIAILEHVLRLFGVDKIASLLADREFIGDAWLAWLQEKAIPFHISTRPSRSARQYRLIGKGRAGAGAARSGS